MKILEDYKKIAQELLFEVDDEKMIKYKDKDGESKEMKAGSAKTMPDEHPAKQAYNKMKDDGGDDKEEPSGQKIGGSDFDRDSGDDSDKDSDGSDETDVEIPSGTMKPNEDGEDETAEEIADSLAKKYDISREYAMERAKEETDSGKTYLDFAQDLEMDFEEMSAEGGQQRYDEPMFDDEGMRKMKYGESVKSKNKPFLKEQLERIGGLK